jgi:hypothetical protein
MEALGFDKLFEPKPPQGLALAGVLETCPGEILVVFSQHQEQGSTATRSCSASPVVDSLFQASRRVVGGILLTGLG